MDSEKIPIGHTLSNLRNLFRETCDCVHSATFHQKERKPYSPTYFMYMFCFFNTLYNIKWKESMESGYLCLYTDMEKDKDKYSAMLDFCFSDDSFWSRYSGQFIRTLLQTYSNRDIIGALDKIESDKTPNGNFYADKDGEVKAIGWFRRDVWELLYNRNFDRNRIKGIVNFIYKVRCNLFHGVKCLDELTNYEQRGRLEIYANILRAVNEMTLKYADKVLSEKLIR